MAINRSEKFQRECHELCVWGLADAVETGHLSNSSE